MTQFERIKNMSARKFVDFLNKHTTPDICTFCSEEHCDADKCLGSDKDYERACKKIIVKWLKSEVEKE